MPTLKATTLNAEIIWLGCVADSKVDLRAAPMTALQLGLAGADGESHSGLTRPSCSRVSELYPTGTEIANTRQLSVVSEEELAQIAADIGVEAVDPAWLGASIVLRGIPDFSHLPPSSRLQAPNGATIVIDMENRPCVYPAKVIESARPGHGKAFMAAAKNRRGVTAWVERAGLLEVGEQMRLFVPDQPVWALLDKARAR